MSDKNYRNNCCGTYLFRTIGPVKKTVDTGSVFLSGMTLAGSWSVVDGAHIQAFALSPGVGTLKITVGCLTNTYPSIRTKTCTRV